MSSTSAVASPLALNKNFVMPTPGLPALFLLLMFLMNIPLFGQHPQHHPPQTPPTPENQEEKEQVKEPMGHDHEMEHQDQMHEMSSAFSLSLPMSRNGSGTSWQPDATPMFGFMEHFDEWMLMIHGNLFLRYTAQNFNNEGMRGETSQFDAPNWVMGMLQRPVGENGLFSTSLMLSLDRIVMGGDGYPLVFQNGESWQGEALVDRQHPHELFSGISIGYSHRLSEKADLFGYFGYPGEPAIGPVAFMHRASALSNPDAPLGHHWQDATHIVFGVATLGVRYGIAKLEGSVFTGREPDENRYDFDKPLFDSYSYRISLNPSSHWALQVSQAFLKSPELLNPEEDVTRTTASILHSTTANANGHLSTSLVYGLNAGDEPAAHSFLVESNLHQPKSNLYGRIEYIQKSPHDLDLPEDGEELFEIAAFTLGGAYRIAMLGSLDLFAGIQATITGIPTELKEFYGSTPLSGQIYLRFTPPMMYQPSTSRSMH